MYRKSEFLLGLTRPVKWGFTSATFIEHFPTAREKACSIQNLLHRLDPFCGFPCSLDYREAMRNRTAHRNYTKKMGRLLKQANSLFTSHLQAQAR